MHFTSGRQNPIKSLINNVGVSSAYSLAAGPRRASTKYCQLPSLGSCARVAPVSNNGRTSGKILIVDDESRSRMALETLLRREGFEVHNASDGSSALSACATLHPDVILLDVLMPGMDGFEVCKRVKASPETRLTPVVLITGLSDTEDRIKGINAGADDFLSKPIDLNELLARTRSLIKLKQYTDELEHAEAVLFSLALSIEARDPYTRGHCERLAEMSAQLGERLRLADEQVTALRRAGVVHDVGKVVVPDAILLKPARLSEEEMEIVRKHPVVGERICAPLKIFRPVLPIIRHHHERFDGSGYPDHLQGADIPLTARILQLADVYDALTTDRPYRKADQPEVALEIMDEEAKRGWWDRDLFDAFREMIRKGYPSDSDRGAAATTRSSPA